MKNNKKMLVFDFSMSHNSCNGGRGRVGEEADETEDQPMTGVTKMATKRNTKTENVETAAVVETLETTAVVETTENVEILESTTNVETEVPQSEKDSQPQVVEQPVEVTGGHFDPSEDNHSLIRTTFLMTPDQEMSQEVWNDIQERLDVLNVESLKITIEYCQDRLQELQRAEIEALEAEMRTIQQKLFSMKGGKSLPNTMTSAVSKTRTAKPIVNPANSHEVYSMGRTPAWLKELMETTGKTLNQLRNGDGLQSNSQPKA